MRILCVIVGMLLFVSCGRSLNGPDLASGDVGIRFLKITSADNATAEFLFYNGGTTATYFMGYGPKGPIYTVQSQSDTGWVNNGPGWCGTGLVLQKLKSGESFEFDAYLVEAKGTRRVGVGLYDDAGEFDRIVWSGAVKL